MQMQTRPTWQAFALGLSVSALILISFLGGAIADRVFVIKPLDGLVKRVAGGVQLVPTTTTERPLVPEGSSVADVSEAASQSVVTVAIKQQQRILESVPGDYFGFFAPRQLRTEEVQQDIGTGFVVGDEKLIVTNKHVVNEAGAEYKIIDKNDKEYEVINIYRDPENDLAILQIEGADLPSLPLGDSDKIRVGQEVIAIGTALGQFRHTVTTGVVSGLGRGITAGDQYGSQQEALENVIQTDAAINPGNSGGPLLDLSGNAIGVNVAVSASGENVGFALPINIVRASIENFNQTGQFNRPFLGVRYQMISERAALANEVPQGAYLVEVVAESPAAKAGLEVGDIITEFGGTQVDTQLASLINKHKVGEKVTVKFWRDEHSQSVDIQLEQVQSP